MSVLPPFLSRLQIRLFGEFESTLPPGEGLWGGNLPLRRNDGAVRSAMGIATSLRSSQ